MNFTFTENEKQQSQILKTFSVFPVSSVESFLKNGHKSIQCSARKLKRKQEMKRFVLLQPIVIYELTMFKYNEQ